MKLFDNQQKLLRAVPRTVLTVFVCAAILGASAWAWLSHRRTVAGIAIIDSPMNIYITAAHSEDLIYLDLTDINLEDNTNTIGGQRYKDYVFSITGENIQNFKLQLAYTTNNQFSFEVYEAQEVQQGTAGALPYVSNVQANKTYYYERGELEPLYYFNKTTSNGNELGDEDHLVSTETYSDYETVNAYAYPIYCQTNRIKAIYPPKMETSVFCNYFILRIMWPSTRTNDGETDILYLSAAQA